MTRQSTEAAIEGNLLVTQLQPLGSVVADVEDHLAIFDMLAGQVGEAVERVNHDVGCEAVFTHPLVHRTDEIGAFGTGLAFGHLVHGARNPSDRYSY